jgi:hypothetical protein
LALEITNYEQLSNNHLQIQKSIKDVCQGDVCPSHKNSKFSALFGLISHNSKIGLLAHNPIHTTEEVDTRTVFLQKG